MLIIDGYNLLFAGETVSPAMMDIEVEREALVDLLRQYAVRANRRILCVFDGDPATGGRKREQHGALEVVFSREKSGADEELIALLERQPDRKRVTVVSSDNAVTAAARRLRAKTCSSAAFNARMAKELAVRKRAPLEPPAKFTGPGRAEVKAWEKIFGEGDE